jgi:hypothetical protein
MPFPLAFAWLNTFQAVRHSHKGAAWFKDKFGLLKDSKSKQEKYIPPKTLFNLDPASAKIIHEPHQVPLAPLGTLPKATKCSQKNKKSAVVDMTINSNKDFTSDTDSLPLDDLSSSDKGSCSKASKIEEDG